MHYFITHFTHIPFDRLVDLAEGHLLPGDREQLQAHIKACRRCSAEAAEIERLIRLMHLDTSKGAPRPYITRVVDLFMRNTPPRPAFPGARARIPASLSFDSLGLAPAFGARSGEPCARQLLYSTEAHDIDLRIEPASRAWVLSGQVLGESAAGGRAELQGPEGTRHASLNEQREFKFSPVPAGRYRLVLDLPAMSLEVDDLKIGI
jgi:anti-sigma factor RsiW